MVGRFSDSTGVAAVATGGQIMQTITGISIGMTAGGTVLIGRYFGARQKQNIAHAVKTMLIVFGLLSLLLTGALILFLDPVCALMRVPPESLEAARQYLLVCACGILFIVGYNVASGILRGLGDSRTPLILIAISCVVNVSTDLVFVGALRMGAFGAAVSTVLAQMISLLLAVVHLAAKGMLRKYRRSAPCFRLYAAKGVLAAGLPIALQEGLVNLSFLIITAMVNSLGLIPSAAVGVVEKLIAFSMLPSTAFSAALSAMTAQHFGAGLMERARRCMRMAVCLSLSFGIACTLLAQKMSPALVGLFTDDGRVIEAGAAYLRSYSLDCVLVCFVFCMNAFLSGGGHPHTRFLPAHPYGAPVHVLPRVRRAGRLPALGMPVRVVYLPAVSGKESAGRESTGYLGGISVCSSTAASRKVRFVWGPDRLSIARIRRRAFFRDRLPFWAYAWKWGSRRDISLR